LEPYKIMVRAKTLRGVSLVEVMVSLVIFCITLPIIYNTLFNTQSYLMSADAEVKLELEANTAMQFIIKDIKETTMVYDRTMTDVPSFKEKFLTDAVTGTEFTDKKGTESSAIILMKYAGEIIMPGEGGNKRISQYELVTYYMKLLGPNDTFYDSSLKLRNVIRLVSEKTFIDPTPLTSNERDWALTKGYMFWIPPKKGFISPLPALDQVNMRKFKITVNTSPPGYNIKGKDVPESGGLIFTRDENNITITLLSLKRTSQGIKTFSQKSFVTATSLY
jgi:hypothetical protein